MTRSQLEEFKERIQKRLKDLSCEEEKITFNQKINAKGHVFRKDLIETDHPYLELRLAHNVYTFNKDVGSMNFGDDLHLAKCVCEQQDPWFEHLNCDIINHYNIDDVVDLDDEWEYGDWDTPIQTVGWSVVYLYYLKGRLPPEGQSVKVIKEDGKIHSLTVEASKVLIDGQQSDEKYMILTQ